MIAPGFTGATLDRTDWLRHDPEGFAAAVADPRARLLKLTRLDPEIDGEGMLRWEPVSAAPDNAHFVLLGMEEGAPRFAAVDPAEPVVRGRSAALFAMLDQLRPEQAAIYAGARSAVDWHMRHNFCAVCGALTAPFRAGWGRKCPNCGAEHFPRVDPVVIMIAEHRDRALLGRQPSWPPGRYSALAGFLEPGESIEEAVARETLEESGIRVNRVRYVASQPWPFPSSLMIACVGCADGDQITVDEHELEDARWFTREEVRAALAGEPAPFQAPPRYAIAHTLLTAWLEGA